MIDHPAEYRRESKYRLEHGGERGGEREGRPVRPARRRRWPQAIITGMATKTSLSPVFPLGSRLNERGRLEVGGCDTIELAREFGTPAYVVAEDDLRARARAFVQAGSEHGDFQTVFASKAFPCTAVLALFAEEGLWCDVASGGELHLALHAGFAPARIVMHGNAKSAGRARRWRSTRAWG